MNTYYIVPTYPVLATIRALDKNRAETYFGESTANGMAARFRVVRSILSETDYDFVEAKRKFAINLPMGSLFEAYVDLLLYNQETETFRWEAGLQSKDTGQRIPLMTDTCSEEEITEKLIQRLMSR